MFGSSIRPGLACREGSAIGAGMDIRLPAAISVMIVGIFLLASYLIASHNGMIANNPGADWSHHAALIDVILKGENIELRRPQLGEFSDQPHLAHNAAAALAKTTGLSPLRTIHIVATISIIVSILIISWRITYLALSSYNLAGALSGLLAGTAALFIANKLTIGFNGQLQYNFYFHQAVGTAAAILALLGVQRAAASGGRTSTIALFCVPILTLELAKIHTAPALWFGAAGSLCALASGGSTWKRLLTVAVLGIACIALLLSDAATRSILAIGQSGAGDLNLFLSGGLWKLNSHGGAIAIGLLVLGLLLAWLAYLKRKDDVLYTIFNVHVGAVAVLIVGGFVLIAMLLLKNKEFYAVGKYVYLLAAEFTILVASVFAVLGDRLGRFIERRYAPFNPMLLLRTRTGVLAFVICFLAISVTVLPQESWAWRWTTDQTFLVSLREDLVRSRAALPSPAPYPLAGELRSHERYYLYISPMGQPRNAAAYNLLTDMNLSLDPKATLRTIPASLIPLTIPLWPGEAVDFAAPPSPSPNPILLFGKWWPAADFGRWTSAPGAYMQFRLAPAYQDRQLCLQLISPPLGDNVILNVNLLFNGASVHTDQFKGVSQDRLVSIPLNDLNRHGDVLISILSEFDPAAAPESALVGLRSMWVAGNCK